MIVLLSTVEDEGSKDKFFLLYEEYKVKVFNMANRILNDSYLAEDVSQDVFTILTKREILDRINEIDSPETKAYIAIITQNRAINVFNKRKREWNISITDSNVRIIEEKTAVDNTQEVIMKLDLEKLVITIKKLPRKYYLPMLLKYVHEFTDKETAEALEIEETTVRKRLERAKKQLRKKYQEFADFIEE